MKKKKLTDDIAVNVAVSVAEKLKENGLSDKQIIEVLVAGYSPSGPMNEHGNIPQVHQIWSKVLNEIGKNEKVSDLKDAI